MRNPQHKLGIPTVRLSLENPHLQRKIPGRNTGLSSFSASESSGFSWTNHQLYCTKQSPKLPQRTVRTVPASPQQTIPMRKKEREKRMALKSWPANWRTNRVHKYKVYFRWRMVRYRPVLYLPNIRESNMTKKQDT